MAEVMLEIRWVLYGAAFSKRGFQELAFKAKGSRRDLFFFFECRITFSRFFSFSTTAVCLHNIYAWLVYSFNVAVVCLEMALKRKVLFYENEALGRLLFFFC